MKTLIRHITVLTIALTTTLSTMAYDFESNGLYFNILSASDLTCEITSGDSKYEGNITIPSTVEYKGKKLKVERIGKNAFLCCSNLTSVSIPNSVTALEHSAFLD